MRARLLSALAACAATAAVAGMAAPASAATHATAAGGIGAALARAERMVAAAADPARQSASRPAARTSARTVRQAAIRPQTTPPTGSGLPALVSETPASYTPNVSAPGACNKTWLGSSCTSTVYDTALVNGEVVVGGAFTQVCEPGSGTACASGTTVTRDDLFAYNPVTGTIDQNFDPQLSGGPVNAVIAGPDNTVYVGGSFATVGGAAHADLVQLNVGGSSDGSVVTGFTAQFSGAAGAGVNALSYYAAGNALYVGGQFSKADGNASTGLARLNSTSGADDTGFKYTLSGVPTGSTLQVVTLAVNPSGTLLVVGGSFLQVNGATKSRLFLISTGGSYGAASSVANWYSPLFTNNCSKEHNYVQDVNWATNGGYFVVVNTGFRSGTSAKGAAPCDAVIRFNNADFSTNVTPAWMNYTGGDTLRSVAVTGNVVYVGGHERWLNNMCGDNVQCEQNSVLVNGIGAVDANTGLALPWWTPGTTRGVGVESITPVPPGAISGFNGGLLIGTSVNDIGGSYHSEEALFPETTTTYSTTGGPIPSGMFAEGRIGGADETDTGTAAMCLDDANDSSAQGNKVQFYQCLNDASQNWTAGPSESIQVNGQCLSVAGSYGKGKLPPNGTKVQLWGCNGTPSQEWLQGSGNTLVSQFGGKCLDDPSASTKNGTQLQIWSCNGGIQQVWPLPAAQAPPAPPATGTVNSQQIDANDGVLCADDTGDATASGSPVVAQECTEDAEQFWTAQTNGTIVINSNLCLDTQGGGTASGTSVVIDTCSGASSQVWQVSGRELVNQASKDCLTLPSTTTGTALEITACSGGVSQTWWEPQV
jgi:Ricin-type beta-trefoil lectin domain